MGEIQTGNNIQSDDSNNLTNENRLVASVAFPNAAPGLYDYLIPSRIKNIILPGMPVFVTLRNRNLWGVVVDIKQNSPIRNLKEIIEIKSGYWTDKSNSLISLYRWIADYYQCELGKVFRPLLRKRLTEVSEKTAVTFVFQKNIPSGSQDEKYCSMVSELMNSEGLTFRELNEKFGVSKKEVERLCKAGYIIRSRRTILREPPELKTEQFEEPKRRVLTDEQQAAVEEIMKASDKPERPFLLYGITGSGKTFVYIELVSRILKKGKGAVILVPEIGLTPQIIQKFRAVLGDVITVIHSRMSDGERRDSLQELITGKKQVVIGVRSAILTPMERLGLIIVDEEHDASYKQNDCDPRYNARDVAIMRGKLQHALVVLGSATPAFESYYNAINRKYHLLRLTKRFGGAALPQVEIVDMRKERQNNNWGPISERLNDALSSTLQSQRQAILLLNRRGFSTILLCKECGFIARCPNCSVSVRYHRADKMLKCHLCGYCRPAPAECPSCGGVNIKYQGTGIQKVEEFLSINFPHARILRMDQDSTRRKGSHIAILKKFAEGKADILIGTQMVAKGLDFPNVSLVGVISADTALHLPDFRASERTFQLLAQVSGRAGRADALGRVIIQTYCPEESGVKFAAFHDYDSFYNCECISRKALLYPPWSRLVRIIVSGKVEKDVKTVINNIAGGIRSLTGKETVILGPSPALFERIADKSRYTLLIKSSKNTSIISALKKIREKVRYLSGKTSVIIDVDPVNML